LLNEHLRMNTRWHRAAHLWLDTVSDRASKDDEHTASTRLHEVVGLPSRLASAGTATAGTLPAAAGASTPAATLATASGIALRSSGSSPSFSRPPAWLLRHSISYWKRTD
jgi:hypothetical protein